MSKTPFFKGFNRLCGRAKKAPALLLKEHLDQTRKSAPGQLHSLFSDVVEPEKIPSEEKSRDRIYTAVVTFWAILGQVFRGGSMRDAVREVQAAICALGQQTPVSDATASYSEARQRLAQGSIDAVHQRVCEKMRPSSPPLLGGRKIMVVDATAVQLEDTAMNQDHYPQPSEQKPGCGFPVMQLVGLFNLNTTGLEHISYSPLTAHEGSMFDVDLKEYLHKGEVLMADRAYCSYLHLGELASRGIDVLMRLHSSRRWPTGVRGNDAKVKWSRPRASARPEHISESEWNALPETMTVRYLRYRVEKAGLRTREVILVTTLMDEPAEALAHAYLHRWNIELCFDDIKTTLGMDFIRAKSPAMARKLVSMYVIAHNLVRWLMQQALLATGGEERRLSFKGALDSMQRFAAQMGRKTTRVFRHLRQKLYEIIVADVLVERPGRFEPRVRKRRPKTFPLMTRPRGILKTEILRKYQPLPVSI